VTVSLATLTGPADRELSEPSLAVPRLGMAKSDLTVQTGPVPARRCHNGSRGATPN
jgi:hypothetical protein